MICYIWPWCFQNLQDCFCPHSSKCLLDAEIQVAEIKLSLLVKLRITENSFGLAAKKSIPLTNQV